MKRIKNRTIALSPLANATGRQYTDSKKELNIDTSGVQIYNKKLPPLKPYKPVQCGMFLLPKYKEFDFSQKGGPTITQRRYVENCLGLRAGRTLPVSDGRFPGTAFLLNIGKETIGVPQFQAVNGFWEAYNKGFIQKVYDKINEFFARRSWYDDYLKNYEYYYNKDKGGFVWDLIEQNIFAADVLKNPQSDIFENTKVAILRYIMYPQDMVEKGYKEAKEYNERIAKSTREMITNFDWKDIASLGFNRINKAASEAYFNDEYRDKITKPNEDIYKKTNEANKDKKTYRQILEENANKLTEDETQERIRKNNGLQSSGEAEGTGSYDNGSGDWNKGATKSNGDKTMLLVAAGILVGIFYIKRKFK